MPGPRTDGWFTYHFEGWDALSVLLAVNDEDEALALVALPYGRQDDWLAFQRALQQVLYGVLRRQRRSRIETLGTPEDSGGYDIQGEIKRTTFDQVILPQALINNVLAQRTIFDQAILKRYAALHIPRLRKVLLIGPPGTGKTTLVKAFAAEHLQTGGYVVYVFADSNPDHTWHRLRRALQSAVTSGLPTLLVVEDLENFITDKNMQAILNTLDGVATPDNPAGTLLLATTNAPEKIDARITQRPGRIDVMIEIGAVSEEEVAIRLLKRFLHTAYIPDEHNPIGRLLIGQVGSHVREVCLLAAIHAVEQSRETITHGDLLWAHEGILTGRKAAANLETCETPKAGTLRGRVGFVRK